MRWLLPLIALSACSEYDIVDQNDDVKSPLDTDETNPVDDTATFPEDECPPLEEHAVETVALNTECEVELSTGSFDPMVEGSWGNSSFCGPPVVGQLLDTNSSGAIDTADTPLLLLYQNGRVVALYGDSLTPAWSSSSSSYGQDGAMALGDATGDGWPDVITASDSRICALDGRDGSEHWCTTGLSSSLDAMGYSYPSLADMDGDGVVEVTAGSAILDGRNGSVLGQGARGKGAAPYGGSPSGGGYGTLSVPVDLDGDGRLELVTGNAAYKKDGSIRWANGGLDGLIAVADFDLDGEGEVVKTSGIYVYGMESDGTEVWGPRTYSGNLSAPSVDDLDGDGTPEIVFAAQNQLVAMEWGGAEIWRATINDSSGAATPTLFDFEMDGYPEVLYQDEVSIRFFSGLDGSVKYQSGQHASYTILESPVVVDVDGDDHVEIVIGHCTNNAAYGAVTVFGDKADSWPPGRKFWNQHGYYISNILDDGTLPAGATPPNWPALNSFRSGDVGLPPSEYWDLQAQVLEVCEDECETGAFFVSGRVANHGNLEVPAGIPVSLRADAGGPILDVQLTTTAIPGGETGEMLYFEVAAEDIAGATPILTADEGATGLGVLYECEETNNAEMWSGGAVCTE